jgi:RNase P/RNase MRP subunit POP5
MQKDKQLKLKKSARDHRRYLLINEKSNKKIEDAILEYIGVLGFAKAAYKKVNNTNHTTKTIGSCLRSELIDVKAALTFAGIKVEKVANTIKGLQK